MSQKLIRALLVTVLVLFGTSAAFAEKVIAKEDRAKLAGIWAEDCANPKGKWVDVIASWVEVYQGGRMETDKEGKRVFKSMGKKIYRTSFDDVKSTGPGAWDIVTKTKGTISLKLASDGKLTFAAKDPNSNYHFEFAGDLTQCK
jgi:hypothetical protein